MLPNMELSSILTAIALLFFIDRVAVVIYRLYVHPLANFPGPKLAAASTLYRAYYQFWKDGKMLHKTIEQQSTYGYSLSFLILDFTSRTAYFEIYSSSFNGTKDPNFYYHLGGGAPETFFSMSNAAEHRVRWRPVASLFAKRHYDRCESMIKKSLDRFSVLLSLQAQRQQPCNLDMGYRSLFMKIVNDFMFSDIPDKLRSLQNEHFDDPLSLAAERDINWTAWADRNFPNLSAIFHRLVPLVALIMATLVQHEQDPSKPKNPDSMMQRLMTSHLDSKSDDSTPLSNTVLEAEATVTMWGGILDLSNILPYGTFMIAQDKILQSRLHDELRTVWPDFKTEVPSYEVLRELTLLNGIVKESLRHTHGVATGPARLVGPGGAYIDGHFVPPKTVVACPSYFVHMDAAVFPDPEKFDPQRWTPDKYSDDMTLVAFSKGRRMCPAEHLANIEMFATFATVFRRFEVTAFETSKEDFAWNQYFSIRFTGRPLQAILKERMD
ncbi:hypothetical protein VTL71DRAFT_9146 [Oculimacula yallundae]|uniref:Cytochrome P450 n=1 Tax=Oculimacula yallundae TaxID=86028 RepID=A0ABR4BTX1_9HELO